MFADDMILYIENPEDSIRKLLEVISEFRKVAGYNTNSINLKSMQCIQKKVGKREERR